MIYDIIVIGGGPAGLTAALYAKRANKSVLIIEKASNVIVQKISAEKLTKLVGFLSNAQGSIINRKL